jgi:hypothetical protein
MGITECSFRLLPAAAVTAVLLTVTGVKAQTSLPIYTDNLVNGFQDWSWATRNLGNTSPTGAS